MQSIISSEIFVITLVAGVYLAALWLYRKTKLALLHPLLVSIPALVAVMSVIGIPYESFQQGSRMINFLLGPSVVALGYVLWEQVEYMKSNAVSIMTSIFVGSLVGIVSVFVLLAGGSGPRVDSDIGAEVRDDPDSDGSGRESGGIPAIAAVIVIVVGIFGGIVGPFVLNKLNIDSKIARGLSLGAAAHGLGTARAMELGALEGAISGLAIGLMGVMTAILVPVVEWVMSLF